ncbi:MAG: FAD synthetase family protein [Anaerolineae bacterium]|nr:FAD synthetase family protein [Anaerolineae bacterium]
MIDLIRGLEQAHFTTPAHVAVGVFDGLHLGHRHLVGAMVQAARAAGQAAIVVTFDPHPGMVLGGRVRLLSTIEEQAGLLEGLGVDALVVLLFTPAVADTPAFDFAAALQRHLGMVALWAGPDFALGRRREGTTDFLRRAGETLGFSVHVEGPVEWGGAPVSSTRIRVALAAGNLDEANGCLGRPYCFAGVLENGGDAARLPGYLCAGVAAAPERLVPADGIYGCALRAGGGESEPVVAAVEAAHSPAVCVFRRAGGVAPSGFPVCLEFHTRFSENPSGPDLGVALASLE